MATTQGISLLLCPSLVRTELPLSEWLRLKMCETQVLYYYICMNSTFKWLIPPPPIVFTACVWCESFTLWGKNICYSNVFKCILHIHLSVIIWSQLCSLSLSLKVIILELKALLQRLFTHLCAEITAVAHFPVNVGYTVLSWKHAV
jgi:hypothetical protein